MKRTIFLAVLLALALVSACQSREQQYVGKAVRLMDKYGLFAEGPSWEQTRAAALEAKPATMDEAYEITRTALKVAGGKHSFLITEEKLQKIAEKDKETAPSVVAFEDRIALITIPEFSGQTQDEQQRYARTVLDALPQADAPEDESLQAVIIDLRGNTGGNMYPMIAAVHRFLPDDVILKFKGRRFTTQVSRSFVLRTVGIEAQPAIDCPVALLTDSLTASSGEALLLCFRGLENVRTFGAPTAGYASANSPHPMPDGSRLVLTQSCDQARTGEVFCDDPIAPDEPTDQPLEIALAWLRSR
ncbi:MAG: S41 family peptidase [Bacteroidales bacterium]|nr:S41 family peptidase [Bacteroidales bacterium]